MASNAVAHPTMVESASAMALPTRFYPTFLTEASLVERSLAKRYEKEFAKAMTGQKSVRGKLLEPNQTFAPVLRPTTPAFILSVEPPSSQSVVRSIPEPVQHWTLLGREVHATSAVDFDPDKEKQKRLAALTQVSTRPAANQITFDFDVTLSRRNPSEQVGLKLCFEAGYYPAVTEVNPTGLIAAWNEQHAASGNVQIGDRIIRLNGVPGTDGEFLDTFQRDLRLNFTIRRFVEAAASQKQKNM